MMFVLRSIGYDDRPLARERYERNHPVRTSKRPLKKPMTMALSASFMSSNRVFSRIDDLSAPKVISL